MPKIAVAGVKGSTGREFLNLLNESGIPADDVFALEAKAPLGTLVSYGEDDELDVSALDTFDFKKADIAIFATTKEQGKRFIKKATGAGCRVIDLSGATFGDSSVPLVIPELNGELLKRANGQATDGLPQVIGVPSSAVYQILLPLAGTIKEHKLKRLVVTTFNSTSYHGHEAMDELFTQSRKIFLNETLVDDEQIFKSKSRLMFCRRSASLSARKHRWSGRLTPRLKRFLTATSKCTRTVRSCRRLSAMRRLSMRSLTTKLTRRRCARR